MPWVDLLLMAVVVLSALFGLVRGFVFELMSLAGWFVAYLAARWLSPFLAPYLSVGAPGSPLNHMVAYAVTFALALLMWSLAAHLARLLIRATPLGMVDRLLGGMFGAVRGALVLLLATLVVGLTPISQSPDWKASQLAPRLNNILDDLKPLLPAQFSDHLPAFVRPIDFQGSVLCAASSV